MAAGYLSTLRNRRSSAASPACVTESRCYELDCNVRYRSRPDSKLMTASGAAKVTDIRIVPAEEKHAAGFTAVLDYVARERRYIGFLEGPPVESMREFLRSIVAGAGVQLFVITPDERVVGWCDIVRNTREGFRHSGRLGMGLLPEYRGRGIGRQLASKAIQAARDMGIERIELEVYASNGAAREL